VTRELVVLGTSSQVPTRHRNHNGYLLRWDGEGILFDPGEGTQRQLQFAGVAPSAITRICVTHFHGDHCLGLPGILARLALDGITRPLPIYFPASGSAYFERLRDGTIHREIPNLRPTPVHWPQPLPGEGPLVPVAEGPPFSVLAGSLLHGADAAGWRIEEPAARRMLPQRLAAAGVAGPDVGRLIREGSLLVEGRGLVRLEEVSEPRPPQRMAFVMDTAPCPSALLLASGVDLLVCESTYADAEAGLARQYGHMTARDAGRLAAEAGVRRLVLTHFSSRYGDVGPLVDEAAEEFPDVVAAHDLTTIPFPPRR
jgi:ribonuclease Z